jgi:hypothetical protein
VTQRFVDRKRAARDALRQILALDEFHHEGAHAAGFLQAVNVRDVRMIEGGEGLSFACEPREAVVIVGNRFRQDFEGDIAIEFRIAGAVDLPHPSFTDLHCDVVDAEADAGSEGQLCEGLYVRGAVARNGSA